MTYFNKLLSVIIGCCLFSFTSISIAASCAGKFVNTSSTKKVTLKFYANHGNLYALNFTGGASCSPSNTKATGQMSCSIPKGSTIGYSFSQTHGKSEATVVMTGGGGQVSGTLSYGYPCLNMPQTCISGVDLCIYTTIHNNNICITQKSANSCPVP